MTDNDDKVQNEQSDIPQSVTEEKSDLSSKQTFSNIEDTKSPTSTKSSSKLALLVSVIAVAAALGSSYWVYNQSQMRMDSLNATLDSVSDELKTSKEERSQLKAQLAEQAQSQSVLSNIRNETQALITEFETTQQKRLKEMQLQSETANQQLLALQQKVDRLATQDNSVWLIAQADFYMKMAARRLWSERDVLTAIALLRAADQSLAQLNDSSLIEARSAIAEDIATLAALNAPDTDGIVASLASLVNQIDKLPLNSMNKHLEINSAENQTPSNSIADWRENLATNWRSFTQEFISVRSVDDASQPLLSADQAVYLRENIRARLLLAAQAVSRQQQAIYQDSLEQVLATVNAQFDPEDGKTQHFVAELNTLSGKKLVLELPQSFVSAPIIEQLVEKRVKNWVANPTIPAVSTDSSVSTNSSVSISQPAHQPQPQPESVIQTEAQP